MNRYLTALNKITKILARIAALSLKIGWRMIQDATNSWNGFFRIYKKEIPIEDQIQTDESGV